MRKFITIVLVLVLLAAVVTCVLSFDFTDDNSSESKTNNNSEPDVTKLQMIQKEGGVVAYSVATNGNNVLYVIVDCNTNTLYRFTLASEEVYEESISGDINETFRACSRSYHFGESGIDTLYDQDDQAIGHAKTNKSFTLKKTSIEKAYSVIKHFNEIDPYSDSFVGQIVCFGHYLQGNEEKAIEWIVLHSDKDRALLVSKYILDFRQYNVNNDGSVGCTWKSSAIRKWLNGEFYNGAFSSKEKAMILSAEIDQDEELTKDNVFLLSSSEVRQYFNDISLKAISSNSKKASWWLRSSKNQFDKEYVYSILKDIEADFGDKSLGVRPAIWVKTSGLLVPEE